MYVSIICIPQLFSEGSYIYPYNDESIITKIKNELNNYWNKIINLSLVDYPLIGIYFRIYHDVKLKYMKLNNSSSLSSAPLSLTSSLLTSNSTIKNFNNIIQSSSSLSHLPSSFLPPSQPSSSSSSQESIRLYQIFFNFYLYWPNENLFIFATFILSCSIWIATGSLLLFHIYLIFIGKTTIDYINSFHSSTSTSSSKSYSNNIRAVGNGGGSSNCFLDSCFCCVFDTSRSSSSNSSINHHDHHHHHRSSHYYNHHRHIHSGQQRTSYRRLKDNFIQIFGNVPWYLSLLPSIRQPPIIDSVMITMNKKNDDDVDDENNNNEFML